MTNFSKAAVWQAFYKPFGQTTSISGSLATQNLRLPGQYADNTGFYHNGFRDYNPAMGRYLESDPIGLAGGTTNTYAYAGSNAERWTDRSGLSALSVGSATTAALSNSNCSQPTANSQSAPLIDPNTNMPYNMPAGLDIQQNIALGNLISSFPALQEDAIMAGLFASGQSMDYQRPNGYLAALFQTAGSLEMSYRDITNFNYGAVSGAAGYSLTETLSNAGLYNEHFGAPSSQTSFGIPRRNELNITQGYTYSVGMEVPTPPY